MSTAGDQRSDAPRDRTRLDSWKAVAVYLNREINTVQRWERNEGLPIHRHVHGKGGSIYAYSDEIDEWRQRRSVGAERRPDDGQHAWAAPDAGSPGEAHGHATAPVAATGSEPAGGTSPADEMRPSASASSPRQARARSRGSVLAVALAIVAIAAGAWWSLRRPSTVETGGPIQSIAVLPLSDLSPQAGEEYFADSMTEALIGRLATATNLKVTSRTSVMMFKERKAPLPEIARSLGVDAVLEGSVTRAGDRLRIIATLVDADADTQLWSGKFERRFEDVLTLQGEVADAIAQAVRGTVQGPQDRGAANREVSSESYRHYLKGRFLLSINTLASIREAIREFESALAVDPKFAPAYAGLASAFEDIGNRNIGAPVGDGAADRSMAAARKALDLNPNLAEAHAALGRALMAQLRWDESESALQRALALNPSDAATHIWLGQWMAIKGRQDEAVHAARRAIALDPLSVRTIVAASFVLGMAGARDEQQAHLRAALAVRPDYFQGHFLLGLSLSTEPATLPEAIEHLQRAVDGSGRAPQLVVGLARAYARAGRHQEARRLAREVLDNAGSDSASPMALASAYLLTGDREGALRVLAQGLEQRSRGIHQLPASDWVRALEDDPRYRELVRRVLAN